MPPSSPTAPPTTSPPRPNRSWWRPLVWTHPGCAKWWVIWVRSPTPEAARRQSDRHHQRRGVWLARTLDGMVAVDGLLDPEAGQSLVVAALEPRARPASVSDGRSGSQR